MEKHAMALGYFFLAVFCVFTSTQSIFEFRVPLLLVALGAALTGLGFLFSACAAQFQAGKNWLVQMVRLARQPPTHPSTFREDHPA